MALLGQNGGLLGVRRVPSVNASSGVWGLNEQNLARRASIWPGSDPIPGLSPILWWDFSDQATVTVASSQITQVTDKGSRGWTLGKSSTGPGYVTGINGLKCLDWGDAGHVNYLQNASTTTTQIGDIWVVADGSFGGSIGGQGIAGLITGTSAWYLTATSGSFTQGSTGFDQVFINGGTTNRFSSPFGTPSIDSPCLIRLCSSTGATFNATDGIQLGNDRGAYFLGRGWSGLVGEYVIFSTKLSTSDSSAVATSLAIKWGIALA